MRDFKYYILLLCFSILSCNKKNNVKINKTNHKIKINFTIDDVRKNIDDNFLIYLIDNLDTITIKPYNKVFVKIPNIDSKYDLLFKNEDFLLKFKNLSSKTIIPNQDFEWNFGIDTRPFNKYLGLMSEQDYNTDKMTKEIFYLQFNPEEYGDGIQLIEKK